jgi:hypothetical protein
MAGGMNQQNAGGAASFSSAWQRKSFVSISAMLIVWSEGEAIQKETAQEPGSMIGAFQWFFCFLQKEQTSLIIEYRVIYYVPPLGSTIIWYSS